ncbi:cyclic lactone autoinducer peptide [Clostridium sp. BJN0013]
MKFLKEELFKKSMKMISSISLFFAKGFILSTCIGCGHQPKCPDEFLK